MGFAGTKVVRLRRVPIKYTGMLSVNDTGVITSEQTWNSVKTLRIMFKDKKNKYTAGGCFILTSAYVEDVNIEKHAFQLALNSAYGKCGEHRINYEQLKKLTNAISGEGDKFMKNKALLKGYKAAIVKIRHSEGEIICALYDNDVHSGDYVLCTDTFGKDTIGKVMEIASGDLTDFPVEYGREIVCKVTYDAFKERQAKLKRIGELKLKMAKKKEELNELAVYQALAATNPEMAEMLKELKELI